MGMPARSRRQSTYHFWQKGASEAKKVFHPSFIPQGQLDYGLTEAV